MLLRSDAPRRLDKIKATVADRALSRGAAVVAKVSCRARCSKGVFRAKAAWWQVRDGVGYDACDGDGGGSECG